MRIAVVDIGTNSTRLLVADVDRASGRLEQLDRRSTVTRLGVGVEQSGRLSDEGLARVFAALDEYRAAFESLGAERRIAVLTSATRDSVNGPQFTRRVCDEYGLDARTIAGEEEARLSFLGATCRRDAGDARVIAVLDIGGGSTELIVGRGRKVGFHVSAQVGVVRHTERHLHHDPPLPAELEALAADVRAGLEAAVPQDARTQPESMIAVAGTATSMAAIDLARSGREHAGADGHEVTLEACERLGAELAAVTEAERRDTPGLHPDRAPSIVAGTVVLAQAMRLLGLDRVVVSEHDILHGVALDAAR
jgi:exopolyphosphatase/guanosine-5'-triphosphate,3'-diphosphate pyrophosphatase